MNNKIRNTYSSYQLLYSQLWYENGRDHSHVAKELCDVIGYMHYDLNISTFISIITGQAPVMVLSWGL